ncbi:hypothetical protein E0H26_03420 [Micromonospora zingiberis]|uniref:WxL domain-containing protein n=1 Tax=Micromonospora zingiberis TaxID=2053011 RepID=A0A4R0GV35_9ACTN|nr:hypothetical protein [Micromonospora zingiberis]TCB99621.1 hypothetical protein E0H26_03420 [Micromonospora zingiberis]
MRKRFAAAVMAGVAVSTALAAPAFAEDTIVTLTVDATGGLSITVPATANIGHGVEGSSVSGLLGPVTVLDQRSSLTPNWTATVISTDFVTGGGSSGETIPNINVRYWSGTATATAGTGTFTPGQPTSGDQQIINVPRTAFSKSGGTGNNFATWNPTLVVNIPSETVQGTYRGTVTHSVL